jgi:hypothetical protein
MCFDFFVFVFFVSVAWMTTDGECKTRITLKVGPDVIAKYAVNKEQPPSSCSAPTPPDEEGLPEVPNGRHNVVKLKCVVPPATALATSNGDNAVACKQGRQNHLTKPCHEQPATTELVRREDVEAAFRMTRKEFDPDEVLEGVLREAKKGRVVKKIAGKAAQLTTRRCNDYFSRPADNNDDGCHDARVAVLKWHHSIAEWRRTYWETTRRGLHDTTWYDGVVRAAVHLQRNVELALHLLPSTDAFQLSEQTQQCLLAIDLGWAMEDAEQFQGPVDTVVHSTYLEKLRGASPVCLADMYDVTRGVSHPVVGTDESAMDSINKLIKHMRTNCERFNGTGHSLLTTCNQLYSKINRQLKFARTPSSAPPVNQRSDGSLMRPEQWRDTLHKLFPLVMPRVQAEMVAVNAACVEAQPIVVDVETDDDVTILQRSKDKKMGKRLGGRSSSSNPNFTRIPDVKEVDGRLFEIVKGLSAECDKCKTWRNIDKDVSHLQHWTCADIGLACASSIQAELVDVEQQDDDRKRRAVVANPKVEDATRLDPKRSSRNHAAKRSLKKSDGFSNRGKDRSRKMRRTSTSSSASSSSESGEQSDSSSQSGQKHQRRVGKTQKRPPRSREEPVKRHRTEQPVLTKHRLDELTRLSTSFYALRKTRMDGALADADLVSRWKQLVKIEQDLVRLVTL